MSFAYASGVGYFARTRASSSAPDLRGLRPEAGVPDVDGLELPPEALLDERRTFGTSGDDRTSSSIFLTRASGIWRSSSNLRAMNVGAVGEYGSTCRTARKYARSVA